MNTSEIRDYRLTQGEAANYNARDIICIVAGRISEDAPDIDDADEIEAFFETTLSVQAAVYSALWSTSNAVVGGMWSIFLYSCAPFVYKTIEGYDLLGSPELADTLRRVCACFPDGIVLRTNREINEFFDTDKEAIATTEGLSWKFENSKEVEGTLNFEKLLHEHYDCFVITKSNVV